MYSEAEYAQSKAAMKRFILVLSAVVLALAGAMVAALILDVEWLVYVSASVLTLASLFLWGNFGSRLFCWNRFLREMKIGLEREATGIIASIDEEQATKEGIEFRAVRLFTGEESDKAGGRLLYADVSRFPLPATVGQKVRCRIYGNYIKAIDVTEE